MKRFLLLAFIAIFNSSFSQSADYNKICGILHTKFPELNFNNKLLAISVWNSASIDTREMNKELLRTYNTYQGARLSGGLKGMIFISISSDNESLTFNITAKKDTENYEYTLCDLKEFEENSLLSDLGIGSKTKNIVFNSNGNQILKNIETSEIFITFNKLTTR